MIQIRRLTERYGATDQGKPTSLMNGTKAEGENDDEKRNRSSLSNYITVIEPIPAASIFFLISRKL